MSKDPNTAVPSRTLDTFRSMAVAAGLRARLSGRAVDTNLFDRAFEPEMYQAWLSGWHDPIVLGNRHCS